MSATQSRPTSNRMKWVLRILIPLVAVIALAAICVATVATVGQVSGVEFNPVTFERRAFHYIELPVLHRQVKKLTHQDVTGKTEDYLRVNKYVPQTAAKPEVWHIVSANHGMSSWTGDCQFLINYFEAEDKDNHPIWIEWTEKNPNLAKVFWPAVSRLAQEELYIEAPDLMDVAKSSTDPKQLQINLDQTLASKFHSAGVHCRDAQNTAAAKHFFDAAAELAPDNDQYQKDKAAAEKAEASSH